MLSRINKLGLMIFIIGVGFYSEMFTVEAESKLDLTIVRIIILGVMAVGSVMFLHEKEEKYK